MTYRCFCNSNICNGTLCSSNYGCYILRNSIIGCLQRQSDLISICKNVTIITSCCESDFCNANTTILSLPMVKYDGNYIYQLLIKIFVPIIVLILMLCLVLIYKYHRRLSKYLKLYSGLSTTAVRARCDAIDQDSYYKQYIDENDTSLSQNNGSRFIDNYSGLLPLSEGQYTLPDTGGQCDSCTSGSGSGMPFLVQRTIARQVQLIVGIGKGRFGEVWRGEYYGELVAVKIFSSRDETSWARETHIYNTFLLRHPNILGYYASDMVSRYGCTQLWLITHYHPLGSLYDHLHTTLFTIDRALKLLHSIASGLAHLHTEIVTGPHGKPRIAHRDLKSKNILMIDASTACIADLGLSVLQSSVHCVCPLPMYNKHKVGTKRYMSPEILAECVCPDSDDSLADVTSMNASMFNQDCPITFDQFISSDVYSFALVMWEVLSRTECNDKCNTNFDNLYHVISDYKVPFYDHLPLDPSTSEMKKVVCIDKIRPCLPYGPPRSIVKHLTALVQECWTEKSQSRPTALRIKKNLKSLLYDNVHC